VDRDFLGEVIVELLSVEEGDEAVDQAEVHRRAAPELLVNSFNCLVLQGRDAKEIVAKTR
jgi:hypothetical protein